MGEFDEELIVNIRKSLADRVFPFLQKGGFGGVGGEDNDLGADEAGEGRGGLGDDAGDLDRFGEGGRLEGGVVEADELLAEDVDLGGEVDLGKFFGAVLGRLGARGEAVLAGVEVAGLGAAFAFFGGGRGGRGHGRWGLRIIANG